uniref:Uncharacterized protein n=1 Tax=Anguilla anguilla TaxID=7936 RepID=A0A0E9U8X4_ANGAN
MSWWLMSCSMSSMSFSSAVSMSLGSFRDRLGSRLSSDGRQTISYSFFVLF